MSNMELKKKIFNQNFKIEMPIGSTFFIEDKMIKIEIPIGSTFFIENCKIKVVEDLGEIGCHNCIFFKFNCINFKCNKENRTDHTDIFFKKE